MMAANLALIRNALLAIAPEHLNTNATRVARESTLQTVRLLLEARNCAF
jgi:hypothetical protein